MTFIAKLFFSLLRLITKSFLNTKIFQCICWISFLHKFVLMFLARKMSYCLWNVNVNWFIRQTFDRAFIFFYHHRQQKSLLDKNAATQTFSLIVIVTESWQAHSEKLNVAVFGAFWPRWYDQRERLSLDGKVCQWFQASWACNT